MNCSPKTTSGPRAKGNPRNLDERFATTVVDSPVGALHLVASKDGLVALLWADLDAELSRVRIAIEQLDESADNAQSGVFDLAQRQLDEYFAGTRISFDVPLDPRGTEFQRSVWASLIDIPYGLTSSYGQQARAINRPRAVRAVAAANGRNPISIVVPCHRVIGADGSLTGFAGGLEVKSWLLEHERGR